MSFFTKWLFLSLLALFSFSHLHAQNSRVVFSTGGSFNNTGNLVSLYSMEPGKQPVIELTRKGDFANAVLVDENEVFFHVGRAATHPDGGDLIIRYDLLSQQALDSAEAPGTQRLAVTADYLVVTRGFGADSAFVLVYDKNNLSQGPLYRDTHIKEHCSEIVIVNNEAWVSYDSAGIGMLARFALEQGRLGFEQQYMLDSLAAGMSKIFLFKDSLLSLAQVTDFPPPNFTPVVRHASLVMVDPVTGGFRLDTSLSRANSPVDVKDGVLYANFGAGLQGLNLQSGQFSDILFGNSYSAGAFNHGTNTFFVQETDYFSFGNLREIDPVDTSNSQVFSTDISGAAIGVAYNIVSGIESETAPGLSVYPNPASDWLSLDFGEEVGAAFVEVMSMEGKLMLSEQLSQGSQLKFSVSGLPSGMYLVRMRAGRKEATARFIKR